MFKRPDEQIILARSPDGYTVSRGYIRSGTVTFASPTCFPALSPPGCPVDDLLQIGSSITVAAYTRRVGGVQRSYLTTPPGCPPAGYWPEPVHFWSADGSVDTVVIHEPCALPATSTHRRRDRCAPASRSHRYRSEPVGGCHRGLDRRRSR